MHFTIIRWIVMLEGLLQSSHTMTIHFTRLSLPNDFVHAHKDNDSLNMKMTYALKMVKIDVKILCFQRKFFIHVVSRLTFLSKIIYYLRHKTIWMRRAHHLFSSIHTKKQQTKEKYTWNCSKHKIGLLFISFIHIPRINTSTSGIVLSRHHVQNIE